MELLVNVILVNVILVNVILVNIILVNVILVNVILVNVILHAKKKSRRSKKSNIHTHSLSTKQIISHLIS